MGLEFLADSRVEVFMICLSLLIGISALGTSYVKHKKFLPAIILIAGILMIAAGHHIMHKWEALLIPIGGVVIAAAHLLNWRLSRRCRYSANAEQNTKYHKI